MSAGNSGTDGEIPPMAVPPARPSVAEAISFGMIEGETVASRIRRRQ